MILSHLTLYTVPCFETQYYLKNEMMFNGCSNQQRLANIRPNHFVLPSLRAVQILMLKKMDHIKSFRIFKGTRSQRLSFILSRKNNIFSTNFMKIGGSVS